MILRSSQLDKEELSHSPNKECLVCVCKNPCVCWCISTHVCITCITQRKHALWPSIAFRHMSRAQTTNHGAQCLLDAISTAFASPSRSVAPAPATQHSGSGTSMPFSPITSLPVHFLSLLARGLWLQSLASSWRDPPPAGFHSPLTSSLRNCSAQALQ